MIHDVCLIETATSSQTFRVHNIDELVKRVAAMMSPEFDDTVPSARCRLPEVGCTCAFWTVQYIVILRAMECRC
jgi:hypothetical protein